MNQDLEPSDPRRLRASDADRDKIAEQIRDAAGEGRISLAEVEERLEGVYAARTYAELERFTSDLPAVGTTQPRPAVPAAQSGRVGGTPGSKLSFAVMSGATRRGRWVVPRSHTAIAFWGGVKLDLRDARFAEREVTIRAFATMGGIEIVAPDDVDVIVDGVAIMGGFTDESGAGGHRSGSRPVVRITGFAFWGGVNVKVIKPGDPAPELEQH